MARKSSLSLAITPQHPETELTETPAFAASSALTPTKRQSSNKGKYHLGGYYDHDVPEVEAFRILSAKHRRSQQELLLEAVRDLVAKYETQAKFG